MSRAMDSSEHSNQQPPGPQRLSALYQYHNAPEVAPAHGLEYDDTVYPVSDKFPVVRDSPAFDSASTIRYTGKHAYVNDNRPPRIIFGMEVKTFLMVAAVMTMIVVGAAVGGAVGGKQMRDSQEALANANAVNPNATETTSAPTSSSTFVAATPTYTALSDCPQSDNTTYSSSFADGSSGDVPPGTGLFFTKYCDLASPLTTQTGAKRITEAFVYSFSDCIEMCAGSNFWNANSNCTVAVYQPAGTRPGNCWVGNAESVKVDELNKQDGTDVAMLTPDDR